MRSPSLSRAAAREAAARAPKRHARAEVGGSSRFSAAKVGTEAASAPMRVGRGLDQLPAAIALVCLRLQSLPARADQLAQPGDRPLVVGPHGGDRLSARPGGRL